MLMFIGIILFILLVVVHELGHMIAAKKSGVEVEEFGIGFPPRAKILGVKSGTTYTINWLPLGGFVKLKGEHDDATEDGSFGAVSFPKKMIIIAAGVLMNWAAAIVIFTIVALIGMPQVLPEQFNVSSDARVVRSAVLAGSVAKGSPAESIGLQEGDQIISLNGIQVSTAQALIDTTRAHGGKEVEVVFMGEGQQRTKTVALRDDPEKGNFGVGPAEQTLIRSTWSAPVVGVGSTVQFTVETYKGIFNALANLLTGDTEEAGSQVAGPVGIVVLLKSLSSQGIVFVLFLIGTISVALAVMNSLPIPALDGGRLFVSGLFKALKKPLSKSLEEAIHGTGMLLLLALIALITVVDVQRLVGG